jgi:hypothetical protein
MLLEARAVDWQLAGSLPGLAAELAAQRQEALAARPALSSFPQPSVALEQFARRIFSLHSSELPAELGTDLAPRVLLARAVEIGAGLARCTRKLRGPVRSAVLGRMDR